MIVYVGFDDEEKKMSDFWPSFPSQSKCRYSFVWMFNFYSANGEQWTHWRQEITAIWLIIFSLELIFGSFEERQIFQEPDELLLLEMYSGSLLM